MSNQKIQDVLMELIPEINRITDKIQQEVPGTSRVRAARLVYFFIEGITAFIAVDDITDLSPEDQEAYMKLSAQLAIRDCPNEEELAHDHEGLAESVKLVATGLSDIPDPDTELN